MIETIQLYGNRTSEKVLDAKAFGWQDTQEVRCGSRSHHTETILATMKQEEVKINDLLNYLEIKKLESEFNTCKSGLKKYEPADPLNCILFFCLLVFPLVIYLIYKSEQKEKIESNNLVLISRMNQLKLRAKELL